MTLSALIRKHGTGNLATAIPAISATQPKGEAATVARIATVAVANPKEEKTAPPAKVGAGETATASRWWLIHYPDRDPLEVACYPDATHAEILERHPDAVAAEPFPDDRRTCDQCANLLARRCQAAKRGEIVASRNYEPIRDLPRRCEGYAPGATDTDRRPGRERWPGLTDTKGTK